MDSISKYSAKIIVIATDKLNFEYLAYRKKRNLISSNFNKSKTLYFSIDDNPELKKFYLYLNGSNEGIINNLIFLNNDKYPQGKIITSITIFQFLDLQQDVLAKKVINELKLIFPDKINNHELIKIFSINESIKNSIDHEYNLCISKNLYLMGFAMAIYGVGGALMGPGLFTGLSLAVGKDEQGAAAGILVSSYAAGFLINPLTGMQLFIINVNFPYYLGIALMFMCLLIAFFDKRLNRVVEYEDNIDFQSHNG